MKIFHRPQFRSRPVSYDQRVAGVVAATLAFGALLGLAAFTPSPGNRAAASTVMTTASRPAALQACIGCHGPTLMGRPHFSPSLHATGAMRHYNKKTFERVMNTGITDDGTPVRKPMRVFHWKAATSDAVYVYLKKLK